MKRNDYKTVGKEALRGFLEQNPDRQFTVDELCLAVNGSETEGKSSVYRHLSELCGKNAVRKFHSEERLCSVYQYVGNRCDCGTHFHEKCVVCGRIEHLDCHASEEFATHLLSEHGFAVNCGDSILYGVCASCRAKGGAPRA